MCYCHAPERCVCCIKVYFCVVNIVYMLFGTAFIILGSLMETHPDIHHQVLSEDIMVPGKLFIIVGVVMVIVSFIGYCGCKINSCCMLVTYIVLATLFLLFSIGITIAVLGFSEQLRTSLKASMKKQQDQYYSTENNSEVFWDKLHNLFECCGIYSFDDWIESQGAVPYSCCQQYPDDSAEDHDLCRRRNKDRPLLRKVGCLQKLDSAHKRRGTLYTICCIIGYILQILCIYCACCFLNRRNRRERNTGCNWCCCGNNKWLNYEFFKKFHVSDKSTSASCFPPSSSKSSPTQGNFPPIGNNMNYGVLNTAFRIEYLPLDAHQQPLTFLHQ